MEPRRGWTHGAGRPTARDDGGTTTVCWRQLQSCCEIGKLNAQSFAIMRAFGVPVLDSLALSRRIPDEHSVDGTHWDAMTVAAQAAMVFELMLRSEPPPPHRSPDEPPPVAGHDAGAARRVLEPCALAIHAVRAAEGTGGPKAVDAPAADPRLTQRLVQMCETQRAEQRGMGLPACVFEASALVPKNMKAVVIRYSCVGCAADHCGEGGGDCGREEYDMTVPEGLKHVSLLCPAWRGEPECKARTPNPPHSQHSESPPHAQHSKSPPHSPRSAQSRSLNKRAPATSNRTWWVGAGGANKPVAVSTTTRDREQSRRDPRLPPFASSLLFCFTALLLPFVGPPLVVCYAWARGFAGRQPPALVLL